MNALVLTTSNALPRRQQLVAPDWLARRLRTVCLIEVGYGDLGQFEQAHIPGAAYLDTACLEALPYFNKVDDASLLALLLAHGVRHDSTVVLYGRGSLAAARAAHLMLYAGVRDVKLLDGGFGAWQAAHLPLEAGAAAPRRAARSFGAPFPGRPDFLIDLAGARAMLARPDAALVSIRTWSEYSGRTSGYSYIRARGDIPGALWGRAGEEGDVNSMSHFQQADGRMRAPAEIARMWQLQGIGPARACAFYCGTGWRASLAFYYAWLMGWERIAVYDGGWFEWSASMLEWEDETNHSPCSMAAGR